MEVKYSVIEIQTSENGVVAFAPIATYSNRNEAESRYYTVLAAAALSNLVMHTAMLITNDGKLLMRQCYDRTPKPEDMVIPEDLVIVEDDANA